MTYRTSHNSLKFLNYIKFKNRSGTFLTPCIWSRKLVSQNFLIMSKITSVSSKAFISFFKNVCIQCQNANLLIDAANSDKTSKMLISKIVCSTDNKICMLRWQEQCLGSQTLQCFLLTQYYTLIKKSNFSNGNLQME